MKKFKQTLAKRTLALLLAAVMVTAGVGFAGISAEAASGNKTAGSKTSQCGTSKSKAPKSKASKFRVMTSQEYVEAMGQGWNLGNSFEGVNTALDEQDMGETAWGNPVVTKALIRSVKAKGYDSIRMPMTLYRRYSEEDGRYIIDRNWLKRYKEVVDWAVEEGLYVMIDIHHDSWLWLKYWDGNKESEEYVRFVQLWEQLAAYFKNESEKVCFETINEPQFESDTEVEGTTITVQDKLDMINEAAWEIIRKSGGNNGKRMIVMPTLNTSHADGKSEALYSLIEKLDDPYIIATVHYYSEWVFSANLGKTGFDEPLWDGWNPDDKTTPRVVAEQFFDTIYDVFTSKGIGVVVGEYGLLGYDTADECNQPGEELKYYEFMNEQARQKKVCLVFWDNGSGINRTDGTYSWKKPLVGSMLEASMKGRSSYATGLDTIYLNQKTEEDISIPLTLNGNCFKGIKGLKRGRDYIWDSETESVTLKKSYVNARYKAMGDGYGTMADLVFTFSSGASWHEYLVKYAAPVIGEASGTKAEGITIPVTFNGAKVRRANAYDANGTKLGANSWWFYLQFADAYVVDYQAGTLQITGNFFTWSDNPVQDGTFTFHVEFYDGQTVDIPLTVNGDQVTCSGVIVEE
ncbi:MAG: cellulase family glycosylhydrolase [Lachnospiraceae bacterium]